MADDYTDYTNGYTQENFNQIPMPLPSEVLKVQPKFELTMDSTGRTELVIRTNSEPELEDLLNTWEKIIAPEYVEKETVVQGRFNGHEKIRYFGGDSCPRCSNKLVTRKGPRGKFTGCSSYPDCLFRTSI